MMFNRFNAQSVNSLLLCITQIYESFKYIAKKIFWLRLSKEQHPFVILNCFSIEKLGRESMLWRMRNSLMRNTDMST